MKKLSFPEVAQLLAGSSLARFRDTPTDEATDRWSAFDGCYFGTNGDEIPARVFYVQSGASAEALRLAIRKGLITPITEVVFAPSAETAVRTTDWRAAKRVLSSRDYLATFMRAELSRYREQLVRGKPSDLELPAIETPSGFRSRIPNPIDLYLGSGAVASEEGQIAVLLGEAGQGKTYLSEWVAGKLADTAQDIFPVLVSARQWVGMPSVEHLTLEEVIVNSFRAFGCPVR